MWARTGGAIVISRVQMTTTLRRSLCRRWTLIRLFGGRHRNHWMQGTGINQQTSKALHQWLGNRTQSTPAFALPIADWMRLEG